MCLCLCRRELANCFDTLIVLMGWAEIATGFYALGVFRALRFLRLVEFIPALRNSFRVIARTLAYSCNPY